MNFNNIILMLLIALFISCSSFAASQKVEIIGNHRIKSGFIVQMLKDRVVNWDNYSEILKEIYATKFFSDVKIDIQGDVVKIYVKENPIVGAVYISGNKNINTSKIIDLMKVKKYTVFNAAQLELDVKSIIYLYKSKGRINTAVSYELKNIGNEHVELFLNIKEGRVAKIRHIKFVGNNNFSSDILKQVIASKESAFYRFMGNAYYFINERLDVDSEYLTKFYLANGYFNFRVADVILKSANNYEDITFVLEEGELQKFGSIVVNNNLQDVNVKNIDVASVGLLNDLKTGKIFNIDKVNNTIAKIKNYFNTKNCYFLEAVPSYKVESENVVAVTININPTEKIYIDSINIIGNDNTVDTFIRKNIPFAENDPFDALKLRLARQNILNIGFFEAVDAKTSKNEDGGLDVDFIVKEKGTGLINIALNYRSDIGIAINFGMTENNLFGEGNELSFSLKKAINYFDASITYTKPNIFDSDVDASVSFFGEHQGMINSMLFNSLSLGKKMNFGYQITEKLHGSLYYLFNYNEIYNVSSYASEIVREQEGVNIISLIGYALSYNTLDSYVEPTSGYIVRGSQGVAGFGGNLRYVKNELSANYFIPLSKKYQVVTQIVSKMGYIFGYSGQSIKVGQRFFVYDMRGFEPSGIGPRDKNTHDSLGGNFFFFSSVQTEFPLPFPTEFNLKGSVFMDIGTVTGVDKVSSSIMDSKSLRSSIGFGVIWKSPMGPLRLDFALPITKEPYDKTSYIRPSIGYFS